MNTPRILSVSLISMFCAAAWAEDAAKLSNNPAQPDNAPVAPSTGKESSSLPTIVVTGSRVGRNPNNMAASIDVIDRSEIADEKARVDLTEDLNGIPGIQGLNRHNYAQDLQVSSRGFGARSTFGIRSLKLIMDGIPASMADGQGQSSTFNLDQIERIEVLQGPLASIYGNQSGGVIQAFTRSGKGAPTVEISGEHGSWNTSKEDYVLSGSEKGVSYLIDDSHFHTDGYRPDSAARRDQQLAKVSFSPIEDGKLTFEANNYQQFAKDPLGLTQSLYLNNPLQALNTKSGTAGYSDLASTLNSRKSILHNQYGINYVQQFSDGSRVEATVYDGNRHVVQFLSSVSNSGVVDYGRTFYGEDVRWIKDFSLSQESRLTLTAGIDNDQYSDSRRSYRNYTGTTLLANSCGTAAETCGVYGSSSPSRLENDVVRSTDPYMQAEFTTGNWVLTGGVRYTHLMFNVGNTIAVSPSTPASASGNLNFIHTTPVLSALYNINPTTKVYFSSAYGFEAPTMNEMFYSKTSSTTVAEKFNFALKASNSSYFEAGLKSYLDESTLLKFDAFSVYMDNEVVSDLAVNGQTAFKNQQTQREGLEWSLDSALTQSVNGRMALNVMKAYNVNTGLTLPGVATKSFFGELNWEAFRGFSVGAEFIARGRIFVDDKVLTAMPAPGYGVTNLKAVWHQETGGWKFKEFVRFDNVGDRTYVGSVIINEGNARYYETGAPKSYMVGLTGSYQF